MKRIVNLGFVGLRSGFLHVQHKPQGLDTEHPSALLAATTIDTDFSKLYVKKSCSHENLRFNNMTLRVIPPVH